jgi:hypothetical protein
MIFQKKSIKMRIFKTTALLLGLTMMVCHAQKQVKKTNSFKSYEDYLKNAKPIVESDSNGTINWGAQYVEAEGQGVIDTIRFKNKAQARAMAIRGAVVVAQRNLLEIIKGVNIVGETTVEDMITTKDVVQSKIEGVIKGAIMIGKPRISEDGMVEVTMRVPLYANNGVAPLLIEPAKEIMDSISRASQARTEGTSQDTSKNILQNTLPNEQLKNVVFNMNGQKFNPSMFPMVVDEKGDLVFDFTKIYDPKKGQFPKYLQLSKDILSNLGAKKGVEIIDLVQNSDGKLVVNTEGKKKTTLGKIFSTLGKVAKFVLTFI